MLFNYKAIDSKGAQLSGSVDAVSTDSAIASIQKRGLVIVSINEEKKSFEQTFSLFNHVKNKDIVILSRQIATLFTAQVSALRVFRMLSDQVDNPALGVVLVEVASDLQGGTAISKALSKHPKVFSNFYVNMVKAGEESGKLDLTFTYLADYLDRNFAVTSKAKNALIYPAFVVFTFVSVMAVMFTVVIPKITSIITDSGQPVPIYTQIVIDISNFLRDYGVFLVIAIIIGIFFMIQYSRTEKGSYALSELQLAVPYVGDLYKKLYLSRIADNMNTLLTSGVPMLRALELTGDVVDNKVYQHILLLSLEAVKGGSTLSDAFSKYEQIPGIIVQMAKVGEETGELGRILDTLAKFYEREVVNSVDTLVDLIEPIMIVALGLGVAFLLASVLIPIYNLSSSI
ncbi:MAG: type II secretion system F family protein [bacterium]